MTPIHRLYVLGQALKNGGSLGILPSIRHLLDHAPILLSLRRRGNTRNKAPAFSSFLLIDKAKGLNLAQIWAKALDDPQAPSPLHVATTTIQDIKTYSNCFMKNRKHAWQEPYSEQFNHIREAEAILQDDWTNPAAKEQQILAQQALQDIYTTKLDATINISASLWLQVSDRYTNDFFKIARESKPRKLIRELLNDRTSLTEHPNILAYIHSYYDDLYKTDNTTEISPEAREARDRIHRLLPIVVSEAQNQGLTSPFINFELQSAVDELERRKASGPDGVPIEFFKELWEFVGNDVLNLTTYIFEHQHLDVNLSTNIIALISKGGQHNLLGN
jgi:hypothetical protein